ncbi:NOP protein chaperone 1-like [Argopecten irradians]|uniref:NOP protein chaperone 1-like n=1 Tax=Argopecten irradians TaxID=31199 RepID=UPI003710A871
MAAPMEESVKERMQLNTDELASDSAHEHRLTKSKDLLNISGNNGIAGKLLVNKKVKASELDGPRKTFRPPPSSILSDVKSFLPKLAKANEDLSTLLTKVPASMVDIESVSEDTQNVIEMNISLVPDLGSESEDSDSDASDIAFGEVTEENIKISKMNSRITNGIIELDSAPDSEDEKT